MPITDRLREKVMLRDRHAIWEASKSPLSFVAFWARKKIFCMVDVLDPSDSVHCWGPSTLDHVKDDLMMGKKAPDDEYHLVTLCWYHNVLKPPSKRLRQEERAYLADCRRASALETGRSDQPEVAQDRQRRGPRHRR